MLLALFLLIMITFVIGIGILIKLSGIWRAKRIDKLSQNEDQ